MKRFLLMAVFLLQLTCMKAQFFTGIIKYRILNESAGKTYTDSMMVVFGKKQIKLVFYEPADSKSPKIITRSSIEDFSQGMHIDLSADGRSYHESTMAIKQLVHYENKYQYQAVDNHLCLNYLADKTAPGRIATLKEEALCGIDYMIEGVKDFSFMGVQPVVLDGRAVLEYRSFQKDGKKLTLTITDIIPIKNTASYFELWGLKAY